MSSLDEVLSSPPSWIRYIYCQLCGTELERKDFISEKKFNRLTGKPYTWTDLRCPKWNSKDKFDKHDLFADYTGYGLN